jgi:hypothetical protein
MSHVEWPTLLITVILSYVIGIITPVHSLRLTHFLDNRKLLKKRKTRQQALVGFNRVKAFREGNRDRYPFYLILASGAVICTIIASTLIIIAFQYDFSIDFRIDLLLLALLAALVALLLLVSIYGTARQIERFDAYKVEFEKRWGPIGNDANL